MYLNVCGRAPVARCVTCIPISCMGPKHAPKDKRFDFSTNLYAPEHLHVFQIWIMHINALKGQLTHKNVQTRPEKFQNLIQHSRCSMLTLENFERKKRQWISFRPQRWDVPYRKSSCLLWEALVCEKHIPKPAPNGTNFVPFGVGLGIGFSQTGPSHNKHDDFR